MDDIKDDSNRSVSEMSDNSKRDVHVLLKLLEINQKHGSPVTREKIVNEENLTIQPIDQCTKYLQLLEEAKKPEIKTSVLDEIAIFAGFKRNPRPAPPARDEKRFGKMMSDLNKVQVSSG